MAPKSGPKSLLIAVDSNVLMGIAEGNKATLRAVKSCLALEGWKVIVTPRVLQELVHGTEHWEDPRCVNAQKALGLLKDLMIEPRPIPPVKNGICELFANHICGKLLPLEERNDAIILFQAAVLDVSLLIACDGHLHKIDKELLNRFLRDREVHPTVVVAPFEINDWVSRLKRQ